MKRLLHLDPQHKPRKEFQGDFPLLGNVEEVDRVDHLRPRRRKIDDTEVLGQPVAHKLDAWACRIHMGEMLLKKYT